MLFGNFIFAAAAILLVIGLMIILVRDSYFIKMIGLAIFQNSMLLFYIAIAKISNGVPPIDQLKPMVYSSPLPHVLMLTAIVVGFATLAVGFALIKRIYRKYTTINASELEL